VRKTADHCPGTLMETFKWPSLESSRGAESTSPDCVAGPDFTCQMQRKLKLFSPLASRTSNAFRFFCFPMHFIFGLNQMVPCFAELIMCLRASPSQDCKQLLYVTIEQCLIITVPNHTTIIKFPLNTQRQFMSLHLND
jgi:hypothetical protein